MPAVEARDEVVAAERRRQRLVEEVRAEGVAEAGEVRLGGLEHELLEAAVRELEVPLEAQAPDVLRHDDDAHVVGVAPTEREDDDERERPELAEVSRRLVHRDAAEALADVLEYLAADDAVARRRVEGVDEEERLRQKIARLEDVEAFGQDLLDDLPVGARVDLAAELFADQLDRLALVGRVAERLGLGALGARTRRLHRDPREHEERERAPRGPAHARQGPTVQRYRRGVARARSGLDVAGVARTETAAGSGA